MPSKYPTCTSDEVVKVFSKMGFVTVSQKGSHKKMSNGKQKVIIPMHNKDLKKGTLKGILEQGKISLDDFMKFL